MSSKNRRKITNYLVMNQLQLKIAAANLCYILVVVGIILLVFMNPFYTDILEAQSPCDQRYFASVFMLLVKRFIPATILLGIVAFVHQLILTHKICGPLVNFGHTFKRLAEKDLTRDVHLRRKDYLTKEARLVNHGLGTLSKSITAVQQSNNQLLDIIKTNDGDDLSDSDRQAIIKKISTTAVRTQRLLNQFKLRE